MRKNGIVLVLSVTFWLSLTMPACLASSQTTVAYHAATGDVFPALSDVDASVTLGCSVVFNSSDCTVLPNNSALYSVSANSGLGALTVNYEVDRPLLKRSGSPSVQVNSTWLLGDSPPVTVYDDGTIGIIVVLHGHINGQISATGNGSATPSNVTWSKWQAANISVLATAGSQNGQTIHIHTTTYYVVYFTVEVELKGIQTFTQDSPAREVLGSPSIESDVPVIPEFPALQPLLCVLLALSIVIAISNGEPRQRKNPLHTQR